MRVSRWNAPEVFNNVKQTALSNVYEFMDGVVAGAKAKCPVGVVNRPDGWSHATVSFTPKRGKNKGKRVTFDTSKRWTGRKPGSLRNTIRRVGRHRPSGSNIRVYAGNYKIYWAFMVEYGTSSTGWGGPAKKQPFMRPTWNAQKRKVKNKIKNG